LRQREYLAQLEEDSEEPTSLATTTEGEHTVQVIENRVRKCMSVKRLYSLSAVSLVLI
jgi:hypothetical protein